MYKKILVPLDGSKFSECTLDHLKAFVAAFKVPEVLLVSVLESQPFGGTSAVFTPETVRGVQQQAEAQLGDYLSKRAADLKKEGVNAQVAVLRGNPADKILEYTKKNNADLIIMSTHGHSGATRWLIGSVADKVVRHSPVPVLLVSPPGCRV